MAYTILVSATNYLVTATSVASTINVTAPATPNFTITTQVQTIGLTNVINTFSIYTNAIILRPDDFSNYYKGDWVSGATYNRGDIVNYAYSLYTCSTGTLTTLVSLIAPPQDLGNQGIPDSVGNYDNGMWRRVVWNEAPRDHLTITNYLEVGTDLSVGGAISAGGDFTAGGAISAGGDFTAGGNASISGNLTVGPVAGNGGIATNGPLYIGGASTFVGTATFLNDVDMGAIGTLTTYNLNVRNSITATNLVLSDTLYADQVNARYGLYSILEVNETGGDFNGIFELNGLIYPLNRGLNGQVLSTNGTSNAYWVNLSDLNYWNLSTDLTTNAHNIITGINSSTGLRNNLSLLPGTTNDRSSINLTDDGRVISLISKYYTEGSPTDPPEIDIYSDGIINIVSGYNLNGIDQYGSGILIKARKGNDQSLSQILVGSARTIGGVGSSWNNIVYTVTSSTNDSGGWVNGIHEFQGGNIRLTTDGTGIQFPDGSIQYSSSQGSTGTYSLPIASGSTLGGIKVGSGLSIDGSGVLSATGGGGGTGTINAIVGNAPIYVTTGSGVASIYLNVGANLSVDSNGFLNAFAGTSTSYVSLGQDMLTNGYKIKTDNTYPGFITVDRYGVRVEATTYDIDQELGVNIFNTSTGKIYINGKRGVDIIAGTGSGTHPTTSQVNSIADYTRLGTDNNHSDLGVNRIRNYAFSGPPLFPNGIQFDDQTIQITAYDDGRFNFGNITPPFNRQSWQDLITQLLGSQGTINTPNTGHWTFGPIVI